MIQGGMGGGNTQTGLIFEGQVDLAMFISQQEDYAINEKQEVFFNNKKIARIFKKHKLYDFLKELDINWKECISRKLLPDDSIYVIINNTLHIIECKFQSVEGSADEKLQTCDFKKKQYQKLFSRANVAVEYIYLLNDWFRKPEYKDVLDYIISVRCQYYFNYIPLQKLGLPMIESN